MTVVVQVQGKAVQLRADFTYMFAQFDGDAETLAHVAQQLAEQTERLLHLAYKLQLPGLAERLHTFIRDNQGHRVRGDPGLLRNAVDSILSTRVMAAAVSSPAAKNALWTGITKA